MTFYTGTDRSNERSFNSDDQCSMAQNINFINNDGRESLKCLINNNIVIIVMKELTASPMS